MRVHCQSSGSSKGGRVGLQGLLLLFFLVLSAEEAVGGLVNGSCHVVLTPVVSVFSNLLLMFLTVLWWLFLPSLVLLLFTSVEPVRLVLLPLVLVVTLFLSLVCNSTELGVQL
jgi:hypothetical protein